MTEHIVNVWDVHIVGALLRPSRQFVPYVVLVADMANNVVVKTEAINMRKTTRES